MQSHAQRLISLFRTIVLAGLTALLMMSAVLLMPAQNSVPPTAVQAAGMPEFASKLHAPPGAAKLTRSPHGRTLASPQDQTLYDNGPYNGTTDAWAINFGFSVSDSFTVPSDSSITGLHFVYWDASTSDLLTTVDMQIGSTSFGGSPLTLSGVTNTFLGTNQYGYALYQADYSFAEIPWSGAGYITLSDACTTSGCSVSNPVYWDENSGPSSAYENTIGSIPSETFTMLGSVGGPPPCFESGGNLQIIHDFTPQEGSGAGVTIDKAGNLDGITDTGGDNSAGFAFRLERFAGWLLDPLFSFLGGYNGGQPTGVIVGPNGTLYGGAQGGIQNCGTNGSQYCGLVFNLTPQPTACLTAMCSWTENVPYRFSSESDGFAGFGGIDVSAFDQQGNLYGTTYSGGTYDAGTVFELMPSGGGWTKTTLYSFTGGNDGSNPTQVLVGNDGNLYGVAGGGMYGPGVVFQLTPSGGQWTESVIHGFQGDEGSGPSYLVQDSTGNLYGIVNMPAAIFTLQKTSSGWAFSENFEEQEGETVLHNLTIDAAGNLYGTATAFIGTFYYGAGAGASGTMVRSGLRNRTPGRMPNDYIFKAGYAGGAWYSEELVFLENMYFTAGGSLALDASGNLYGTTSDCGTYGSGTVWQLSP